MQFETFNEFLAMGGHGLYVWVAYGVTIAVLLATVVSLKKAWRQNKQLLRWQISSEQNQPSPQDTQKP